MPTRTGPGAGMLGTPGDAKNFAPQSAPEARRAGDCDDGVPSRRRYAADGWYASPSRAARPWHDDAGATSVVLGAEMENSFSTSAEHDQAVRAVQPQQQSRPWALPDRQNEVEGGEPRPDPVGIGVLGFEGAQ